MTNFLDSALRKYKRASNHRWSLDEPRQEIFRRSGLCFSSRIGPSGNSRLLSVFPPVATLPPDDEFSINLRAKQFSQFRRLEISQASAKWPAFRWLSVISRWLWRHGRQSNGRPGPCRARAPPLHKLGLSIL